MYPIIEVPANTSTQLEQLGTKAKHWFRDEDGNEVLFKEGRPGTGENWAEKVCCEICRLLGIPHAEYELALWNDREGVLSPTFVPDDGRLIHGNELLAKMHEEYEEHLTYRARQHTLSRVVAALKVFKPLTPMDWESSAEVADAVGVFAGYLMLDALVSNQDRHHENWAIINSIEFGLRLAPTFDHASSLGRNETDERRMERLDSNDKGRSVEHFCSRARSGFYKNVKDAKPMATVMAFHEIAKISPVAARYWLDRLYDLTFTDFESAIDRVPNSLISNAARLFALKMLEINRNRLLNLQLPL